MNVACVPQAIPLALRKIPVANSTRHSVLSFWVAVACVAPSLCAKSVACLPFTSELRLVFTYVSSEYSAMPSTIHANALGYVRYKPSMHAPRKCTFIAATVTAVLSSTPLLSCMFTYRFISIKTEWFWPACYVSPRGSRHLTRTSTATIPSAYCLDCGVLSQFGW